MTDEAVSEWVETGEEFMNPILKLAKESASYDAFLAGLPALQAELSEGEFVEQMAKLMFQARGLEMRAMPKNIVPKESLEWFKRKGIKPSFDYRDVWKEEHANAFTVAKMLNADLLVEVKQLVEQAIAEGQTFEQFRDLLKPLLVKSGWWGVQVMDDPLTQESKPVQLGSEGRLKTIYRTNMRTARAAGQWERIENQARHALFALSVGAIA